MLDTTTEIEDEYLAQYILSLAKESDEWETYIPENIANEDDPWDEVRLGNVDYVDYYGDGLVEVGGTFDTRVVTEHIRATFHHPAEVRTAKAEGAFTVMYHFEDTGHATGTLEVY
ncbi:hypothetical protein [Halorubrum halodurans]|uniref:Uncharacterized protein n=1 Tax=Halorubrum halodurans TaxID=1383851 RepID=A0A256IQR4_9EURY|nr:hypothetical protein [Halorubrum halodurans]OYR58492.1 hypothetical protein DJ70_02950 [Halorubrum halodurans]